MSNHASAPSLTTVVMAAALVDESAANVKPTGVDMTGYDRVRFMIQIGAMVSGATLDAWVIEDANSNMTNGTNITGAALVQVANTKNNSVQVIDVHRPSKRYVGVTLNAGTANVTLLSVLAERFRGTGVVPPSQGANDQYVAVQAN